MLKNLKALRIKAGISQQRLADAVGVSQQSINKYENHNIEPDIATLICLADFFQTSVDYLIGHSTIDRVIEQVTTCDLNQEEICLLTDYRQLSPQKKQTVRLVTSQLK